MTPLLSSRSVLSCKESMKELCIALLSIHLIILCLCRSYLAAMTRQAGKLKFVVIGDTGGRGFWPYSTPYQRYVAQELAMIPDVDFFLGVGDNFYYNGVKDVEDKRFYYTFEGPYNFPSLYKDWYMVAGNHDYLGNVSAQILYSKKSIRWKFPNYFYTKVFRIPNSNKTLQIILLDTTCLCYANHREYKKEIPAIAPTQMKWLRRTLENSNASYIVVSGHHPMYSGGWHGPNKCMQKNLEELFEKQGVSAYFSGHDHTLQHIKKKTSRLEHFVSGSASYTHPPQLTSFRKLEPDSLKFFQTRKPGFLLVTADDKQLRVKVHVFREKSKYKTFLKPREELLNELTKLPKLLRDFFKSTNITGE